MSDPKSSYGEPVDEPKDAADDVVSRAHEGLADAEAVQRGEGWREDAAGDAAAVDAAAPDPSEEASRAASVDRLAAQESPSLDEHASERFDGAEHARTEAPDPHGVAETITPEHAAPAVPETSAAEQSVVEERVEADGVPWYERDDVPLDEPAPTTVSPAVTASEPVAPAASEEIEPAEPVYTPPTSVGQPIFVQAPEPPRARGNRGTAGAIGLLAAVVFAVLFLAARLGLELFAGTLAIDDVPETALGALATWGLWVPAVTFFLGFWLLGAFINRGSWGHWVVWGLLVGVAAYAGHLLGALFEAPFWMLTARQGAELIEAHLLAPLAIVAFVLGRELTIWFGAWVAARGRRVTDINDQAQREYERTLEAGPQLHQV